MAKELTALGGVPLVVRAFWSLGLPTAIQERVQIKQRELGYQPMLAVWAETDVVLADQFRDGNVPAMMEPLTVAKAATLGMLCRR